MHPLLMQSIDFVEDPIWANDFIYDDIDGESAGVRISILDSFELAT